MTDAVDATRGPVAPYMAVGLSTVVHGIGSRKDIDRNLRTIEDGISEILHALQTGAIDPDDRRWYTLRQYQFLADVERTFNDVAMEGRVLS